MRVHAQKGMSLIEILVVLGIIGSVMALLAPSIFGNKQKANVRTAKIIIAKIENSINEFYNDCDQLPDSLDQLVEEPGEAVCENWGPNPYVKSKDLLDPWKNELVYEQTGSGFKLTSLGQDGAPGGEGFDKDIDNE